MLDFVPIWALLLAAAVFFYVLLDGFDLGVGILYGLAQERTARNLIMNSISPVWDGNETWLVFGGMGLLAAFPIAFAVLIPAVYFPILIMLLALIFRGVAFEFHFRNVQHVTFWDRAFCFGSLIATFAQGIVLGTLIQGIPIQNNQFVGSAWDCFTPFSIFTGIALVFGYALLGAGWLILKCEGELQATARRQGRWCFIAVLIAILVVSLWTPLMDSHIAQRWFSWPNIAFFAPVPLITIIVAFFEWRTLNNPHSETAPFVGAVLLFLLSYFGIAISLYPMIVPRQLTFWQAASSPDTQAFLLIGTLFLLPIIVGYSAWSYWVFRGKVRADVGYH